MYIRWLDFFLWFITASYMMSHPGPSNNTRNTPKPHNPANPARTDVRRERCVTSSSAAPSKASRMAASSSASGGTCCAAASAIFMMVPMTMMERGGEDRSTTHDAHTEKEKREACCGSVDVAFGLDLCVELGQSIVSSCWGGGAQTRGGKNRAAQPSGVSRRPLSSLDRQRESLARTP